MDTTIIALHNQLSNDPGLSYVKGKKYGENSMELIELNQFPFFNVVPGPGNLTIGKVDGMSFSEAERHTFKLSIDFATRSIKMNVALMGDTNHPGFLAFQKNIWSAIRKDMTLSGAVKGISPGSNIDSDILEQEGEDKYFIARGQMIIEFFKDIFLK